MRGVSFSICSGSRRIMRFALAIGYWLLAIGYSRSALFAQRPVLLLHKREQAGFFQGSQWR
jgi:hypothetical protein